MGGFGTKIGGAVGQGLGLYGGGGLLGKGQTPEQKADLMNLLNDETGKPKYPGFQSLLDKETGLLPEKYMLKSELDTQALDKLQSEALGAGPSTWAQLQLDMQSADQAKTLDNLAKQAQGGVAGAQAQLAMKGGLSSGASERLSAGGARDLLAAQQGAQGAGAQQKLGILAQDAATKQAILQSLPGMQIAKSGYGADVDKYNLGNVFSQKQQEEMAKLADYQEQMKGYAAKKSGLATIMGGGGKKG